MPTDKYRLLNVTRFDGTHELPCRKISPTDKGKASIDSGYTLALDTFHHLVFRCDNTTGTLFVNGVQVASGAITAVADSTSNSYIGVYGNGTSYEFLGNIAILRIYHKALTASEVLQNYTVTKDRFGL